MEKISEHLTKDFSIVRLYRDDLKELEKILNQTSDEITWTTGGYKFDSLTELLDKYEKPIIKELLINSRTPYATIEFRKSRSSVSIISSELKDEGLFTQLCKVLSASQRKFQFIFSFTTYWILLITYFIVEYAFDLKIQLTLYGAFLTFITFFPMYGSWIKLKRNSIIKLIDRNEETNFWNRNKDKIILLIVGALIGAIINFFINHWIGK